MSPDSTAPAAEFRRYRRVLGRLILVFISIGSVYLLVSVGVTIYRRRNFVPSDAPPAGTATVEGLQACLSEVEELDSDLERHLESFHNLLDGYEAETAQKWEQEGVTWRHQWADVQRRCQFNQRTVGPLSRELDALGAAHAQLGTTETIYTKALERFGLEQAPRLADLRKRVQEIGEHLERARQKTGENTP